MPAPTVFNAATSQWVHAAAIADPSGGTTVDDEARSALVAVLAALRRVAVIAGATSVNTAHGWNAATSQVVNAAAIADPSGGVTVDSACRTALVSILTVLRNNSVIAGAAAAALHREYLLVDDETLARTSGPIVNLSTASGDVECRTAVNAVLAALRSRGLIEQA